MGNLLRERKISYLHFLREPALGQGTGPNILKPLCATSLTVSMRVYMPPSTEEAFTNRNIGR